MTAALDFSTPHLIRNDGEYDEIVGELNRLLDENPEEGSAADEKIEFLSLLVEHYDRKHFELPGRDVTPQQVVEFMLEQKGLSRVELANVMGGKSRVSEFFNGDRPLSMGQVVKLRDLLGISADLLLSAPREAPKRRGAVRNAKATIYGAKRRTKKARTVSERSVKVAQDKTPKGKSKPS